MFLSASSRSRLLLALLFGLLFFACKKDSNLLNSDVTTPAFVHPPKYAISLADAKDFYIAKTTVPGQTPANFSGSSTAGRLVLNHQPQWDKAIESQTQMGRPVVLVPLGDTVLTTRNDGRVNAKMQFSRLSPDTIAVEIIISIADSAYANNLGAGTMTLDNFTGAFLVTDLGGYFNYGIKVNNGQPVAWIRGLKTEYLDNSPTEDRTGGDDGGWDCIDRMHIEVMCIPAQVLTGYDCNGEWHLVTSWYLDCDETPGAGSSNTGPYNSGTGGPSGAGGNGGSSSNNGNGGVMATVFKDVPLSQALAAGMSIDYFVQHGGQLPVDIEVARCLESMQQQCNYTSSQLAWFTSFAQHACPAKGYLEGNNYDQSTVNAIKQTIDAMSGPRRPVLNFNTIVQVVELQKKMNFTAEQLEWVVMNTDVLPFINDVLSEEHGEHLIRGYFNFMAAESYSATASDALRAYLYLRANDVFTDEYEGPDPSVVPPPNLVPIFPSPQEILDIAALANVWLVSNGIDPNDNSTWAQSKRASFKLAAYMKVMYLGWTHTALDICGFIPGWGEPCDLVNGVVYWIDGDNENAVISAASTIPFLGVTASGYRTWAKIKATYNSIEYSLDLVIKNGRVHFGDRGSLRTVLQITDANKEAHHIIPWDFCEHPLIQRAATTGSQGGFHMNHAKNGLPLEKYRTHTNPNGQHANHPQYNTAVKEKLDQLQGKYGNAQNAIIAQKLHRLENELAAIIKDPANQNKKLNDMYNDIKNGIDISTY